jgi:hypothetical protein
LEGLGKEGKVILKQSSNKQYEALDQIRLSQKWVQWHTLVDTLRRLRASLEEEKCFASGATISFSIRTVLHKDTGSQLADGRIFL